MRGQGAFREPDDPAAEAPGCGVDLSQRRVEGLCYIRCIYYTPGAFGGVSFVRVAGLSVLTASAGFRFKPRDEASRQGGGAVFLSADHHQRCGDWEAGRGFAGPYVFVQ